MPLIYAQNPWTVGLAAKGRELKGGPRKGELADALLLHDWTSIRYQTNTTGISHFTPLPDDFSRDTSKSARLKIKVPSFTRHYAATTAASSSAFKRPSGVIQKVSKWAKENAENCRVIALNINLHYTSVAVVHHYKDRYFYEPWTYQKLNQKTADTRNLKGKNKDAGKS